MRTGFQLSVKRALHLSYQTLIKKSECPFPSSLCLLMSVCVLNVMYRFLVPNDLCAYQFNFIIRKRINLPENDSLYFFVNGKYLLKAGESTMLMSNLYKLGLLNILGFTYFVWHNWIVDKCNYWLIFTRITVWLWFGDLCGKLEFVKVRVRDVARLSALAQIRR